MRAQARGHAKRAQILTYLHRRVEQVQYPPTIREIAEELGCSIATVHRHVRILVGAGAIVYTPGQSRTIRPVPIPGSSSGRTADSGSANRGSNP